MGRNRLLAGSASADWRAVDRAVLLGAGVAAPPRLAGAGVGTSGVREVAEWSGIVGGEEDAAGAPAVDAEEEDADDAPAVTGTSLLSWDRRFGTALARGRRSPPEPVRARLMACTTADAGMHTCSALPSEERKIKSKMLE